MRLIGQVENRNHAERIAAYLLTREISCLVEEQGSGSGKWDVWVRNEDQLDTARSELEKFQRQPDDERYRQAVELAQQIHREQARVARKIRNQQVNLTTQRWNAPLHKVAPLTAALIVVSCVVWLFTGFGENRDNATFQALAFCHLPVDSLTESERAAADESGRMAVTFDTQLRLGSVLRGEIWRLVTPIFIHFGPFHLLFNMYWLLNFSRQIEFRFGSWWLLLLVLLIAIPSNLAGAIVPENVDGTPLVLEAGNWLMPFGGMSGVLYGLFGYIWMKVLFDPKSGLQLTTTTAMVLMIWLFACMTPQFQEWTGIRVGNWAHGIGLLVGLAIGYWPKLLSDIGIGGARDESDKK